jgi:hypothetical protein
MKKLEQNENGELNVQIEHPDKYQIEIPSKEIKEDRSIIPSFEWPEGEDDTPEEDKP